jgi:UDP-3-O-[3-hydroxymyristoyl] glucosamine N-acyltransferase
VKFIIKNQVFARDLPGKLVGVESASAKYVSSFYNADNTCAVFYSGNSINEVIDSNAKIVIVGENLETNKLHLNDKAIIVCNNPLSVFVDIVSKDYDNKDEFFFQYSDYTAKNNIFIGRDCFIPSNVTICKNTEIGCECRIQPSSVIGSIGLAYADNDNSVKTRFPHLGGVIIGDNVDIGANVTIVKGILQNTIIGSNTKIGNNVNIGHNVKIGKNCFISSGVTLAGSVIIEDECWISPSVTINNKVTIKRKSFIAIGSLINKNTVENGFYAGSPARKIKDVK